MANNEYVNKVVLADGRTLIDLTGDDVQVSQVHNGIKFHLPSGEPAIGTCMYDAYTSDATATAAEILDGKTAYKNGEKMDGTMPNRGKQESGITDISEPVQILNGYHDGSGSVGIDSTEAAKLIPGNIKSGVEVLGVTGTYTGEGVTAQSKSVTPTFSSQTILPDQDYDYLSQVTVAEITIIETDNAAGGKTVTIGYVPAA